MGSDDMACLGTYSWAPGRNTGAAAIEPVGVVMGTAAAAAEKCEAGIDAVDAVDADCGGDGAAEAVVESAKGRNPSGGSGFCSNATTGG